MENYTAPARSIMCWCLAAVGTAMLLISALASTGVEVALLIGGVALFAAGAGWYVVCLIRN